MADATHAHPGLPNVGNSCFLNVVLQSLAAAEPLRAAVQPSANAAGSAAKLSTSPAVTAFRDGARSVPMESSCSSDVTPLTSTLLQVLVDMWDMPPSTERTRPPGSHAAVHVVDPKPLLNALRKRFPDLITGSQQDAHEALSLLLDACQMEEVDVIKSGPHAAKRRGSSTLSISTSEPSGASSSPQPRSEYDKLSLTTPPSAETLPLGPVSSNEQPDTSDRKEFSGVHIPTSCASVPPRPRQVSTNGKCKDSFPLGLNPPPEMAPNAALSTNNPYVRLLSPHPTATSTENITSAHADTSQDLSTPTTHNNPIAFPSSPVSPQHIDPSTPVAIDSVMRPTASMTSTPAASGGSLDQPITCDEQPREALVDQIFEGKLASTIVCQACGYISQTYEPFYDLSLSIPQPASSGAPNAQSKKRMAFLRLSERWSSRPGARSRPGTPGALNVPGEGSSDMPAAAGTSFSPSMAKAVQRTAASLSRPGSAPPEESSPAPPNLRKLWTRSVTATPNHSSGGTGANDIGLGPQPSSTIPSRVPSRPNNVSAPITHRPPSVGPTDNPTPGKERKRLFSRTPKPEQQNDDEEPRGLFRRGTTLRRRKRKTEVPPSIVVPPQSHAPVARHTTGLNFTAMTPGSDDLDDEDFTVASPVVSPQLGLLHPSPLGPHSVLASPPTETLTASPSLRRPGLAREGTLVPLGRDDTLTPNVVGKMEAAASASHPAPAEDEKHSMGHSHFGCSSTSNRQGHLGDHHRLHRHFRRSFRPHSSSEQTAALTSSLSGMGVSEPNEEPAHLLYIAQLLSGSPRKAVDPSVLYALRDAASNRRGKLSVADVAAACASAAQTGTSLAYAFQEPPESTALSGGSALQAQEGTGLVAALNAFTQSELLEGEDAFLCKRCWRNQHGLRARASSTVTEGSDSSPDADSDHDELPHPPGLGLTGLSRVPSGPVFLASTSRASMSVPALHTRNSATSLDESDASAPMLRSRTGSAHGDGAEWASDASASGPGTDTRSVGVALAPDGNELSSVMISGPGPTPDRETAPLSGQSQSTSISSKPPRRAGRIRQPALKRYLITSAPPVLIVQFKRFAVSSATGTLVGGAINGQGEKLEEYVSFPPVLDVAPWLAPPKQSYDRDGRPKFQPVQQPAQEHSTQYTLVAVIVHTGQLAAGHYTAFVQDTLKSGVGKFWVHVSDEQVRYASWEEVSKARAYMLFYQRVEPSAPATPATPDVVQPEVQT